MHKPVTHADALCHDLQILHREEDGLHRLLAMRRRYLDATDWTAMTRDDEQRAARRGRALQQHLRHVKQAIDQRIFELFHLDEEEARRIGPQLADPRGGDDPPFRDALCC
ncbi:hypothetical protein PX699_16045 [Sphingobium sp. H39-3-25]|uniref:hypothetical protein n=1 Tax=Sphingobium arseniciresistens TaxID=3030834 RepID=UPI0023B939C7|nr:hypothetical protein [Sphingobium arseniciresistens]